MNALRDISMQPLMVKTFPESLARKTRVVHPVSLR